MTNKELDRLIIEVLRPEGYNPIATYVVSNKINQLLYDKKEVSRVNTNSVRTRLKKLEKKGVVKTVPTSYKSMLSWVLVNKNEVEK